jgi:hypothetical protein
MTLRGHVRNGRVEFDEPTVLPEGAQVQVSSLVHASEASDLSIQATGDRESSVELERRFRQLVREWKEATLFTSSGSEMLLHPAYQRIIGLGKEAIPLLVAQLRSEPDHWFWALKSITGEVPVATCDRGNVKRMADAWLNWAQQRGY